LGVRARLLLARLAGWGLLRIFLLRALLRVGRWRLLLGGGKADAAGKCQRQRAGPQKIASHGYLLRWRRDSGIRSPSAAEKRSLACACSRATGLSGRSTDTTAEARVWFHPRAWR
jgi:hypothetical protein